MKVRFKKSLSLVLFLALLLVPTVAYASTYNTSYSFTCSLEGTSRSFSAGTLKFNFYDCSQDTQGFYHPSSSTFTVKLYQDDFMKNPYIGSQTISRTGGGTAKWTHMAAHNYFIDLEKSTDGCRLKGRINMSQ